MMGAIKKHCEDLIEEMAYEIVDYGMYQKETQYSWADIQFCCGQWLWQHLAFVSEYENICNSTKYTDDEKNDLCSTMFLGLAETMLDEDVMELLES